MTLQLMQPDMADGILKFTLSGRYKSKKKAFSRYAKKYSEGKEAIQADLEEIKANCCVVRVLVHTQIKKIGYGQRKAHLSEIQVRSAVQAAL